MTTPERIKSLRLERGFTQKALAQRLKVSDVTVGCWEKGVKSPSMQSIVDMANLFSVSTDYILCHEALDTEGSHIIDKDEYNLLSEYRELDEYSKRVVRAVCALEHRRSSEPRKFIPKYYLSASAGAGEPKTDNQFELITVTSQIPNNADFAVVIKGDSMYPTINDGETVYVKKISKLKDGDIGIFNVNGYMLCKRYKRIDREEYLVSDNTKFPTIRLSNYTFLGRVVLLNPCS